MQYALVETSQRTGLVAMEPTNFGRSYKELDSQTDESGWEEWVLYSSDGFDNEFAKADEARYAQRGWWGVNFRDRIKEDGRGLDDKGKLGVVYVSHNGLEYEQTHTGIWAPKKGFIVPTKDGMFYDGTIVPFETVPFENKKEALRRLEAKGIDSRYLSGCYREERINRDLDDGERIVGRVFHPVAGVHGRFYVILDRLPSFSGRDGVGSRPAYKKRFWRRKPEIIMSVYG